MKPQGATGGLRVEGLRRRFGEERIFEGASLHLDPGCVAALVGPNGSGKTTLLRILSGVLEPDAGDVDVAGAPAGLGRAGFVPAGDRMLNWRLTGRRNLEFFARIAGIPRAGLDGAVRSAADALGGTDLLDKRAGVCSTGQRRRLMLAVGFVASAPVVLMDEPFADLDEDGCAAVSSACRRWADAGGLVLYATPQAGTGPPPDVVFELRDGAIGRVEP